VPALDAQRLDVGTGRLVQPGPPHMANRRVDQGDDAGPPAVIWQVPEPP
jgi:hypothetical protein